MRVEAGPSQPKPAAIVLNSTCFQHNSLSSLLSNIKSDLTKPNDIGYKSISTPKSTQDKPLKEQPDHLSRIPTTQNLETIDTTVSITLNTL